MSFTLRHVTAERKLCQQLSLEALEKAVPLSLIRQTLHEMGANTPRQRKLNLETIVLLLIALHLYPDNCLGAVLERITHGLRLLWPEPEPEPALPGESALVYRRYQLGARPMVALFRRVCRPLANNDKDAPAGAGAFLLGRHLLALDGQVLAVADTPSNAAYFGRTGSQRGEAAFPQVQLLYLCEVGTHALIDAGVWPVHTSEHTGAKRLLRSVPKGSLVLFDRGLYAYEQVLALRGRGAHVLCRLPDCVQPAPVRPLADGSRLVWLFPPGTRPARKQVKDQPRLLVRLIEYTISDPALPGFGQRYRLLTTLLCPDRYPAQALALAYHERWEVEVTLDELETHLLALAQGPLRSKKPVGVLQEVYGLLIAHFAVRSVMYAAAQQAGVDPDRLSFVRALRLIGEAIQDFAMAAPRCVPRLWARLLAQIAARPLPERRARSNPRVLKRTLSGFPRKRALEHAGVSKLPRAFSEAIVLI